MEFSTTDKIAFPIEVVFSAHRDHLVDLAQYLPSVESIVVESREEKEGAIHFVNVWTAARTEVPRVMRPFIKPEMLKWIDRAAWFEDEKVCRWQIQLGFLKDAIFVQGENRMKATPEGNTEVTIAGEIKVDATKIPGVPKFMAGAVGGAVESFVVKMITPNLKKTNEGVATYIASQQAAPSA